MKNILVILISFLLLGACAQTTALIGPVITVGSTGNVMQAGFSYGSNMAIKNTTGKTPSEHVSLYIEDKKEGKRLKKREAIIRKFLLLENYFESTGKTLTCFFVFPFLWNFTLPSINEKSVSSFPLDTLLPGKILVPLCLTIIDPAVMVCPSADLTPKKLGLLSLPFLVLPTPFLCAIIYSLF